LDHFGLKQKSEVRARVLLGAAKRKRVLSNQNRASPSEIMRAKAIWSEIVQAKFGAKMNDCALFVI